MGAASSLSREERVLGCLIGGAIGDALGAGIEFQLLDEIIDEFGENGVTDITPAYGHPAPITDDTQMTLFTAEGLIVAGQVAEGRAAAENQADAVWNAYQRWYHTQIGSPPADDILVPTEVAGFEGGLFSVSELHTNRAPGNTCMGAVRDGIKGTRTKVPPINNSKGCGGVMRVAPAGLVAADVKQAYDLGCDLAALTHGHPAGWVSAGAFAAMIFELAQGASPLEAVEAGLALAQADPADEEVAEHLTSVVANAAAASQQGAPIERTVLTASDIEKLGAGWVGEEALAISVACFLSDAAPREQLLLSVNHSGDSDSTGAILGNLIGAAHGVEAFPEPWRDRLELSGLIASVAAELAQVGAA